MREWTYFGLTVKFAEYYDQRPLDQLKSTLDQIYFGENYRPHQWFLTANGRTAIYLFLKSLNLAEDSEVIIQSFTCVTAVNPIIWAGLKPIFVDIDPRTLSLSPEDLESKITPQTKVIILQHTFGITGPVEAIRKLAKEHGLLILEDCAHALGVKQHETTLGTGSDAAIISFGIEKTLSTKLGGALLVNNPDLIKPVESAYRTLPRLSRWENFLWLLYPGIRQQLRKLRPGLANFSRHSLETIGLLKQAVSKPEYRAEIPKNTLATLPGVHAKVILDALAELKTNLQHRQDISSLYDEWLKANTSFKIPHRTHQGLIKYPLLCESVDLRNYLEKDLSEKGIHVSDWYNPPIYPNGVDYRAINYRTDTAPEAEAVAKRIINLPTGQNIDARYATMICNEVNAATARFSKRA